MALNKRALSDVRKVIDAIHQSRLANVRRHRAEIAEITAAKERLSQENKKALDIAGGADVNLAAIAAFDNWATRKSAQLQSETTAVQHRVDDVVLAAIKSLGQTRAVKRIEAEIDATERSKAERVAERAVTATTKPRK